jgi:hypothetical protein
MLSETGISSAAPIVTVGNMIVVIPSCIGLFSIDRAWKSHNGRTSDNNIMLISSMRLKWKNDSFLSISIYGMYIMLRNMTDLMTYASILTLLD